MTNDDYAREVLDVLADKAMHLEACCYAEFYCVPWWSVFRKFNTYIEWRAWRRARALCEFAADFNP